MTSVSGEGASSDQGFAAMACVRCLLKMEVMSEDLVGADQRERAVEGLRLGCRA